MIGSHKFCSYIMIINSVQGDLTGVLATSLFTSVLAVVTLELLSRSAQDRLVTSLVVIQIARSISHPTSLSCKLLGLKNTIAGICPKRCALVLVSCFPKGEMIPLELFLPSTQLMCPLLLTYLWHDVQAPLQPITVDLNLNENVRGHSQVVFFGL